jgi:hypothetical protein
MRQCGDYCDVAEGCAVNGEYVFLLRDGLSIEITLREGDALNVSENCLWLCDGKGEAIVVIPLDQFVYACLSGRRPL